MVFFVYVLLNSLDPSGPSPGLLIRRGELLVRI